MRDGRIEYLIRLVEKSNITELEIVEGWGRKIRISKQGGVVTSAIPASTPATSSAELEAAAAEAPGPSEVTPDEDLVRVVAPMVGTFYRASAPDAAPFVDVGSQVEPGQTLCIIEAMKIMNEIASEVRGSVRRVVVENAQPVEFGQTLFLIEKRA